MQNSDSEQVCHSSDSTAQQVARQALDHFSGQKGSLLPILHAIQHALGYVPDAVVPIVAQGLQLSRAEIHGVISFYAHFRSKPPGRVVLQICRAESCQAVGGEHLAAHARQKLGCDFHQTSADGGVTLEPVYCLGLCAQSPAVMLDGEPHARMTPARLDQLLAAKEAQA
ncbi:MAG TPA: formate dehydrogenase subunit gamma [Burkholderiaceae bacterium]|nr:formate dehydrogenase subunit gamma [Burkholderiaceae bacterium]